MRRTIFKMVTASLCLLIISLSTTGCNLSIDKEKDIQIGKMEEQIKTLRLNNARLKKQIVKSEIIETGTSLTFISLTGVFVTVNNLIWWVTYRRKQDEMVV